MSVFASLLMAFTLIPFPLRQLTIFGLAPLAADAKKYCPADHVCEKASMRDDLNHNTTSSCVA